MRRTGLSVGVILVLVIAAAMSGQVLAHSTDPETPIRLVGEVSVSGTLAGSPAGSFHYYAISYPGDGRAVTIEMTYTPADPVTKTEIGFNVYGHQAYFIGSGEHNGDGQAGHATLVYADNVPATWLVQVYNYSPVTTISYKIVARGIETPTPTPTAVPVDVTPIPTPLPGAISAGQTISGTLVGSGAGAFGRYTLAHPGDGSERAITVRFFGAHAGAESAIGFEVYGSQGQRVAAARTDVAYQYRATIRPTSAGDWLIQVHNYAQDLQLTYTVAVE